MMRNSSISLTPSLSIYIYLSIYLYLSLYLTLSLSPLSLSFSLYISIYLPLSLLLVDSKKTGPQSLLQIGGYRGPIETVNLAVCKDVTKIIGGAVGHVH